MALFHWLVGFRTGLLVAVNNDTARGVNESYYLDVQTLQTNLDVSFDL